MADSKFRVKVPELTSEVPKLRVNQIVEKPVPKESPATTETPTEPTHDQ